MYSIHSWAEAGVATNRTIAAGMSGMRRIFVPLQPCLDPDVVHA
jgi:hypothetical protein